jgi:hypothetical protein
MSAKYGCALPASGPAKDEAGMKLQKTEVSGTDIATLTELTGQAQDEAAVGGKRFYFFLRSLARTATAGNVPFRAKMTFKGPSGNTLTAETASDLFAPSRLVSTVSAPSGLVCAPTTLEDGRDFMACADIAGGVCTHCPTRTVWQDMGVAASAYRLKIAPYDPMLDLCAADEAVSLGLDNLTIAQGLVEAETLIGNALPNATQTCLFVEAAIPVGGTQEAVRSGIVK